MEPKTIMVKVGTLTNGIRTVGTSNGTTKAKEKTKVVSLNKETNELQLLRIPKLRVQAKPYINLSPRSWPLFALEELAEHPPRSRSVRTSGGRRPEGDDSEKGLMDRLEKIQHQMNRSAIHGLDVDQELVDAQQAIYASLKALRTKALEQEALDRRAASAPAPARDSRFQQDLDSGMHPRAAKKAEKDRQRAADHQRRLAEEKASKSEQQAKSRSRHSSPQRESRPEGRHPKAPGGIDLARRDLIGREGRGKKRRISWLQKRKKLLSVLNWRKSTNPLNWRSKPLTFSEKPTAKGLEQILNQDQPRSHAGPIRILWMSLMIFHHLSWMNWRTGLVKALRSLLKARLA